MSTTDSPSMSTGSRLDELVLTYREQLAKLSGPPPSWEDMDYGKRLGQQETLKQVISDLDRLLVGFRAEDLYPAAAATDRSQELLSEQDVIARAAHPLCRWRLGSIRTGDRTYNIRTLVLKDAPWNRIIVRLDSDTGNVINAEKREPRSGANTVVTAMTQEELEYALAEGTAS